MNALETYNSIFKSTFNIDETELNSNFNKENVPDWDSVHQLTLVSGIEGEFDLMLDADDILGLISYEKGKEILKKYDIIL